MWLLHHLLVEFPTQHFPRQTERHCIDVFGLGIQYGATGIYLEEQRIGGKFAVGDASCGAVSRRARHRWRRAKWFCAELAIGRLCALFGRRRRVAAALPWNVQRISFFFLRWNIRRFSFVERSEGASIGTRSMGRHHFGNNNCNSMSLVCNELDWFFFLLVLFVLSKVSVTIRSRAHTWPRRCFVCLFNWMIVVGLSSTNGGLSAALHYLFVDEDVRFMVNWLFGTLWLTLLESSYGHQKP